MANLSEPSPAELLWLTYEPPISMPTARLASSGWPCPAYLQLTRELPPPPNYAYSSHVSHMGLHYADNRLMANPRAILYTYS